MTIERKPEEPAQVPTGRFGAELDLASALQVKARVSEIETLRAARSD